jgi:hypothetical protein
MARDFPSTWQSNAAAIAIAGFNRNDYRNLSVTRPQKSAKSLIKWRAIQNKIANSYVIEITLCLSSPP